MPIVTKVVVGNGTEEEFIKSFIKQFVRSDDRIKLFKSESEGMVGYAETDSEIEEIVNEQFFQPGTSNYRTDKKPTFRFDVAGVYYMTMTRNANANSAVYMYSLATIHLTSNGSSTSVTLQFKSGSSAPGVAAERKFVFRVIANTKALLVQLGSYSTDLITGNPTAQQIIFSDSGTTGFCAVTGTGIFSNFVVDDGTNTQTGVIRNRLGYTYSSVSANLLEVIGSKVFTTAASNGIRIAITDALCDCTTLTSTNQTMVINGATYFPLTSNTLMPVS